MLSILSQGIGGLGIFFAGMYLLSENLKKLSGRRFRQAVARWTKSLWAGLLWGFADRHGDAEHAGDHLHRGQHARQWPAHGGDRPRNHHRLQYRHHAPRRHRHAQYPRLRPRHARCRRALLRQRPAGAGADTPACGIRHRPRLPRPSDAPGRRRAARRRALGARPHGRGGLVLLAHLRDRRGPLFRHPVDQLGRAPLDHARERRRAFLRAVRHGDLWRKCRGERAHLCPLRRPEGTAAAGGDVPGRLQLRCGAGDGSALLS